MSPMEEKRRTRTFRTENQVKNMNAAKRGQKETGFDGGLGWQRQVRFFYGRNTKCGCANFLLVASVLRPSNQQSLTSTQQPMRSILILLALVFSPSLCLFAENRVSPLITEVTVYRSGAKISSVATVRVPTGSSEVIFENLSPYFNANSLQVKIKGTATLSSAVFSLRTPNPGPENPRAPVLRDSLILVGDDFTRIRDEREVLQGEKNLIDQKMAQVSTTSHSASGNTTTLSVNELKEAATYYRQRLLEIKERMLQLVVRERKLTELNRKLKEALQKIQPNVANQTGEIALQLDATGAQSLEITCTYLVYQASWSPLYDLRSEGLDKPLQLAYKANVRNETGFDWKAVTLHLSTANPTANNNRPVMSVVFADFRPVTVYKKMPQQDQLQQEQLYNLSQAQNLAQANDLARSKASNYYIDGVRVQGSPPPTQDLDALAILHLPEADGEGFEAADFVTNFDLEKPQDVLSNGKDHVLAVDKQDIPAQYEYHAVPKLDPAVFLLAKITDYGKYNLLPGLANIFYQDTYVGQTQVNPNVTSDTLLLSLGRDEQIAIKRVQPKDFTERKKVFSSSVKETFAYEITVKNNKSLPVHIEVLDQVPVSKQKEIEVELLDKDGATYNTESGKLKWELNLAANQNKRVRFSYSVKYPKDRAVSFRN